MSNVTHVELKRYFPNSVKRVITVGSSCWIGEVDDATVLKYPHERGEEISRLQVERQILTVLGQHPRIIELKFATDDGLYLERAINGDILEYLAKNPTTSPKQRLRWCRQAADAVAYTHSKHVLHCDIRPRNLLLDKKLDIKLADFQGKLLSKDGEVVVDGWSGEPCKYSCPRPFPDYASVKTDLFALGSTIYFIMMGHDIFPDINELEDGADEEVQRRFRSGKFPGDLHPCSTVTEKCWKQLYHSGIEVAQEIDSIERSSQE